MVLRWLKTKLKKLNKSEQAKSKSKLHRHNGLDSDAVDIVLRLRTAGFESYLVGGCVRDFLLGKNPKDFDIATSASPQQIKALIKRSTIIGKRFKIVLARRYNNHHAPNFEYCPSQFMPPKDKEFQITTFRRKPELVGEVLNENVFGSAKDDALRRDFSINALFLNPKNGEIIDFLDGKKDLQNKIIRIIGNPEERYKEDPVRLLRALRFQVRTGFHLSGGDKKAFKTCAQELRLAKKERTREEILKSFREGYSSNFLKSIREHSLWPFINESFAHEIQSAHSADRIEKLAKIVDETPWPHPLTMTPFFFVLFHHRVLSGSVFKENDTAFLDFRMSNSEKEILEFLAQAFSKLKRCGDDESKKEKFLNSAQKNPEKFFCFYYCFKVLALAKAEPYAGLYRDFESQLKAISVALAQRSPSRRGPAGRARPGGRRRFPRRAPSRP